jgi:hypothetical protein
MSQTSKRFTPAQKAEIVRRHRSGKEPVSDLADKFGAQPSQIHNWVRQVLEQAERAFQVGPGRPVNLDNAKGIVGFDPKGGFVGWRERYENHLNSDYWQQVRRAVRRRAKGQDGLVRCQRCGSEDDHSTFITVRRRIAI